MKSKPDATAESIALGRTKFAILKGGSNRGKGQNIPITWDGFSDMLEVPLKSEETMQAYIEGSQDYRNEIKASNGWYYACPMEGGHRTAQNVYPRRIATIDVDEPDEALREKLRTGTLETLAPYEYICHSTKSATSRKPKCRVIILLDRVLKGEDFRAICTLIALELIDGTLNSIDDVSFRPAQLMYLPVVSSNQEYHFYRHRTGLALDPYALAERWGIVNHGDDDAWRNYALIPAGERQGKRREAATKAENPREKRGTVGAVCRAYDVEDIMVAYDLPYELTDGYQGKKPRYTYTNGSGSGGVVVQDDGLFIYSHHQSDPCGEQSCNAFDMVRLHLYGELDKGAKPDTPPQKMPSYLEAVKLFRDDKLVKAELLADMIDVEAIFDEAGAEEVDEPELSSTADIVERAVSTPEARREFESGVVPIEDLEFLGFAPPTGPPKNWMQDLDLTEAGQIKVTAANIAIIVQNDPRFWGKIAYNEMTGQKYVREDIITKTKIAPAIRVKDRLNGDMFSDQHRIIIRMVLEGPAGKGKTGYGLKVTDRDIADAVEMAALRQSYHPVREFVERNPWDGEERLDTMGIRYLGLSDTPYHRAAFRLTMIAMITRVYEPGHKFDHAMVLEGKTGIGKSTFIKAMGMGRWFGELTAPMDKPQACVEQMMGNVIIMELPELAGLHRAEVNDVKSFLSRNSDTVRLAYRPDALEWKRQCVFVGSTNDSQYLKDPTGNRRFWPIKIPLTGFIDIKGLVAEMPQLYAEAYHRYLELREAYPQPAVLPLYLQGHDERLEAAEAQETARAMTAAEEIAGTIQAWVDTPVERYRVSNDAEDPSGPEPLVLRTRISAMSIWSGFYGRNPEDYKERESATLARAMQEVHGFEAMKNARDFRDGNGRQRWRIRIGASEKDIDRGWMWNPADRAEEEDDLI